MDIFNLKVSRNVVFGNNNPIYKYLVKQKALTCIFNA